MRLIELQEYRESEPHQLSATERDSLKKALPSLTIQHAIGTESEYRITPSSTVGAVELDGLSVLIRPKIGIPQLISLACYAIGLVIFQERDFGFPNASALPDFLALALASQARRAFSRGLLHNYRVREEALHTVRGRIRFADQLRRRFGTPLPVEVRYDEFTDDILPNRLVKAAAYRLRRMPLLSPKARAGLGWTAAMLDAVSLREFPSNDVPVVAFDRLNEHYRGVIAISLLVLRYGEFEALAGAVRAPGFLMNMNDVFQEFVTVALRQALGVSSVAFGERSISTLDQAGRVNLKPDLVWREGSKCLFVGDAKYKKIEVQHAPNADLYQILAYATALDLPGGMLIYAKGEGEPAVHTVRHSGKRLEVAALDLCQPLEAILKDVGKVAHRIKALRDDARRDRMSVYAS